MPKSIVTDRNCGVQRNDPLILGCEMVSTPVYGFAVPSPRLFGKYNVANPQVLRIISINKNADRAIQIRIQTILRRKRDVVHVKKVPLHCVPTIPSRR
ncbi:MAG: hypothetical protein Q8R16_04605 [bacterium]|nr:hypothetical protein [bacterium]